MQLADRLGISHTRIVVHPALALAVLPTALLIVGLYLRTIIAPIYAGLDLYDYDPAYVYLFSGAGIIEGYTPRHVDHPGTPLQILSGVISYLAWLVIGEGTFAAAVYENPEFYLAIISTVLLTLNVSAVAYLGVQLYRATARLPVALIAQSGILLLGTLAPRTFHAAPEALQLFAATMSIGLLTPQIFLQGAPFGWRRAAALGFILALGITAKVTFVPLLGLLLLLPSVRAMLVGAASAALSAAIILAPVWSMLDHAYQWLHDVTISSGRYGHGEPGFIDLAKVPGHALTLFTSQPILLVAMLACVLVVIGAGLRNRAGFVAGVLVAVIVVQLAMVLKHFEVYYALPVIALASTLVAWWAHRALGGRGVAVVAAAMIFFAAVQTWSYADDLKTRAIARTGEIVRLNAELARHPSAIVVGAFRARSEIFARQFAVGFLEPRFARVLAGDGPDALQYERWKNAIAAPGAQYDLTILNKYVRRGFEIIMVLPRDLDMPELVGDTLLDLPDAERVIRVKGITLD